MTRQNDILDRANTTTTVTTLLLLLLGTTAITTNTTTIIRAGSFKIYVVRIIVIYELTRPLAQSASRRQLAPTPCNHRTTLRYANTCNDGDDKRDIAVRFSIPSFRHAGLPRLCKLFKINVSMCVCCTALVAFKIILFLFLVQPAPILAHDKLSYTDCSHAYTNLFIECGPKSK